jgi:hypothetical protein
MEVLIITIESHDDSEFTVLEIVRSGKQVNEDGDLIDRIELVELPDYDGAVLAEGRFAGLYRKFKEFSADL